MVLAWRRPARADDPDQAGATATDLDEIEVADVEDAEAEATIDDEAAATEWAGERTADRTLPDYDGLPEPGDDAGDVGLWAARIVTGPIYLVTEYLVRRPIAWAVAEVERHRVLERLRDFFTFGPDDRIAVFPTFFYEFGFQPSLGVMAIWDELLLHGNHLQTQAGWAGDRWLSWWIVDRIEVHDRWSVTGRFLARERPDYVFGGIGPNATDLPRARFGAHRIEPELSSTTRFWQSSDLELHLTYRGIGFVDEGWSDEPSVGERARSTGQGLPHGYATGYEALSTELYVDLDTRTPYAPPESGARIAAHAGVHAAFGGLPELDRWVSWGGSATLAADLLGGHRVLGVSGDAHGVTPLGTSDVPFTELVELGGQFGLLPGHRPGHVLGYSAAGLTLHYTWPIWAFLDAKLYFGTANAFGLHFEDFDVALLRMTFGLDLQPRVPDVDLPFTFNFAFATDTFERGASVSSFRLSAGAREVL